jgi:hypothetical protein
MRHCCQIIFFKGQKHQIVITRTIHDNFLYVKNLATRFHKSKTPLLSSSLTSAKRPIPSWKFIRSLKKKGFPSHFRNWIVAPLTTATSRLLLNLVAGFPTRHGRGLRQRDTLSPLLFNLLFPLTRLPKYWKVTQGMVSFTSAGVEVPSCACLSTRTVAPIKKDTQNFASILDNFEEVTGLPTNFLKSSVVKSLI